MKYYQQFDETDCGAACLSMVVSHYGHVKRLTTIREAAGTDRQGTNLAGMLQAAQLLGFNAKALKGKIDAFTAQLPVPLIAHVIKPSERGNLLHFLVVRKINKKYVEVWDPSPAVKKQRFKIR
jgi:ATP-binding cassette subfamily B protein